MKNLMVLELFGMESRFTDDVKCLCSESLSLDLVMHSRHHLGLYKLSLKM